MADAYESSRGRRDVSPMRLADLSEGLNVSPTQACQIGFDIETFSPFMFPSGYEDPVVNATLAVCPSGYLREGLVLISLVYPPSSESVLLWQLHRLLNSVGTGLLLTYNGTRFDIRYVVQRGKLYRLDFESVFADLSHLDLYDMVRRSRIDFPCYSQKIVEKSLGVQRVIEGLSGGSYHRFFLDFMEKGDPRAIFYNIEDSLGCLRILRALKQIF